MDISAKSSQDVVSLSVATRGSDSENGKTWVPILASCPLRKSRIFLSFSFFMWQMGVVFTEDHRKEVNKMDGWKALSTVSAWHTQVLNTLNQKHKVWDSPGGTANPIWLRPPQYYQVRKLLAVLHRVKFLKRRQTLTWQPEPPFQPGKHVRQTFKGSWSGIQRSSSLTTPPAESPLCAAGPQQVSGGAIHSSVWAEQRRLTRDGEAPQCGQHWGPLFSWDGIFNFILL